MSTNTVIHMESLAAAAAVIILVVFSLGLLATLFAFRPPRSAAGRVFVLVLTPLAFSAGAYLFFIVVTPFRLFGLAFAVAAAAAFKRALVAR